MPTRSETVSVRVTTAEKARIAAAAEAAGLGLSDFSRGVLLETIDGGVGDRQSQELALLRRELSRLHRDFGNAIVKLLQEAGEMDRSEAADWARRRLKIPALDSSAADPPGKG